MTTYKNTCYLSRYHNKENCLEGISAILIKSVLRTV